MPFAEGATVLDIASGEGYGSALLGTVARRVIGIDIDEHSVAHAKSKYKDDNLSFVCGDCTTIPLLSDSVDLVVSFETLEHIIDHIKFFNEISRILKPDGVLVISTPDRVPYNEMIGSPNPYHLKELDRAEFKLLLRRHFKSVHLLGQCYLEGTLIDPLKGDSSENCEIKSDKRWVRYIEEPTRARKRLAQPIYLIGVASNQPLPKRPPNLLTTAPSRQLRSQAIREAQNTEQATSRDVEQLRASLAAAEEQQRTLREMVSDRDRAAESLRADIEQRAAAEAALRSELQNAERDAETRGANAEAVKAEIAVIKDVLSKTDRNLQERAAAAEALQAELKLERTNLAEAEHRESKHRSALTALQAEMNFVRIEFEEAERRRREGEAAAAARQAEITALRIELAAARDVGKAAWASLRIAPAPILRSARNTGWLGGMLRRFGRSGNYPLPSAG
jgi:SAM-dependent methyltransferase